MEIFSLIYQQIPLRLKIPSRIAGERVRFTSLFPFKIKMLFCLRLRFLIVYGGFDSDTTISVVEVYVSKVRKKLKGTTLQRICKPCAVVGYILKDVQ